MEDFKIIQIANWRSAPQRDVRLIKSVVDAVEKAENGSIRVVISTAARDRDNDTIEPAGWDLSNYKRNPVVLFAHDHHMPNIGLAPKTGVVGDRLVSYPEFAGDVYPFAGMIEEMVRGGWMKAASVGFNPKTWIDNRETHGYDFQTQELLEWSFVPVGSNPEALVGAKSAGIDLTPMRHWTERALDEWGRRDLSLDRDQVERIHRIATGEKTIVTVKNGKAYTQELLQALEELCAPKIDFSQVPPRTLARLMKEAVQEFMTQHTGRIF